MSCGIDPASTSHISCRRISGSPDSSASVASSSLVLGITGRPGSISSSRSSEVVCWVAVVVYT